MPDRALPRYSSFVKRTDTHSRLKWQYENDSRPKSERKNPQTYDISASEEYRRNFGEIDWSK